MQLGLRFLKLRPFAGPFILSVDDEMNQELLESFGWFFEPEPGPTTVSMTVAELQQLNTYADHIQVRLDEVTKR